MTADHRSMRYLWIAGIVLLIGTVIGTTFVLNSGAQGVSPGTTNSPPVKHSGYSLGYVDSEHGIAHPYPVQLGEIVLLREDGFRARKGDWLLKIDDQVQKLRLAEADAALKEAEKLPDLHDLKVKQQEQVVLAAKHRKEATKFEISTAEREYKAMMDSAAKLQFEDKFNGAKAKAKQIDCEIASAELEKQQLVLAGDQIKAKVKQAKAVYDQAKYAVDKCVLAAPEDGVLLRSFVHVGEALGPNPKMPALEFVQDGKKIIRAEILQEWASRFKKGQNVEIEDDSYHGPKWTGKITSIANWYAHKRSIVFEPFTLNDVRSLECVIEVNDPDGTLRIGQRVRVGVIESQ